MDEFKVGDKVRAKHADGREIISKLVYTEGAGSELGLPIINLDPEAAPYLDWLERNGWVVSLVERAEPELPTEPGWYLTRTYNAVYLAADGYWTTPADFGVTGEGMRDDAPFTRLEPVADTARKVLDAVIARTTMHCNACSGHLADIRKEFGEAS